MKSLLIKMIPGFMLLLLVFYCNADGREPLKDRALLQYCLDQKNLEYKCPRRWEEYFISETSNPHPKVDRGYSCYKIESPRQDMVIVFVFPPFGSIEDSIKVARLFKLKYARNEQYLAHARAKADTLNGRKITHYPKQYAKKVYRADHAGEYKMLQSRIYQDKYDSCRVIFMQRNNIGQVELHYYYNSNTRNIDKYIRQTRDMIRFKKE
jgi:hypothetical protein